jgi:hypothetical protein
MNSAPVIFVIPTYRLRDVPEAIETYDEHFWSNGHSVKMMVFDDSSLANHEKYYSRLEQTKTVNDLYYVGPHQKEQFLRFLSQKLQDRKLDSIVRNLFRPSYVGNRNFSLIDSAEKLPAHFLPLRTGFLAASLRNRRSVRSNSCHWTASPASRSSAAASGSGMFT